MSTLNIRRTEEEAVSKSYASVQAPIAKPSGDPFRVCRRIDPRMDKPFQWILKRTFDLVAGTLILICLTPLLLILALIVRLTSPGPVLFKQKRIGLHGQEFYMYKFRSMVHDAETQLNALLHHNETNAGMFKLSSDPRTTSVGRVLRKYSLDELPQIFNVLKGEMSLVGPRPPIGRELRNYKNWHYVRFASLPGITGLWQVSGRSRIKDFDRVVALDYQYISRWNILLDAHILLKTFPVVFLGKDTA